MNITRFATRVNPSSTVFSFPDSTHHNDPVEAGLREEAEIGGDPPLETVEELAGEGLAEVWAKVVEHQDRATASGAFAERRRAQQVRWTWQLVRDGMEHRLRAHPAVRSQAPGLEEAVLAGELTPALAARRLLEAFLGDAGAAD